jgi:sigma-B regulation protein RsbU (phosphoserine phosphatase)
MNSDFKILIIDHDPAGRKTTRAALEMAGYSTASTASATDGLRLAHRNPPALLLLDANLPDVDGINACQQMKADPRLAGTLVVLFSAAGANSRRRVRGLEAGAVEFQTFPIEEQELLARVQALLRIRVAVDVTERKREQQQAQEQLVSQEKLAGLEQLAGGVGHELPTP